MQQQPHPPSLSTAFIATLISHSPHHTIPHEFILKSLQIANYTLLPTLGYLPLVQDKLTSLSSLIERHELTSFLIEQGIGRILDHSSSLFAQFTENVLPSISERDFYLGTDRSMRQEHSPGSYLIVYEEDTPISTATSLRWQKHTPNQVQPPSSSWVQVCPSEDIVTIGQQRPQAPQWSGMKFYTRQGHSAVELGRWKGNTPKITLMIKTPHGLGPDGEEVYLREFSGKSVVRGELRYVRDGVLCRYRENGGFGREQGGSQRPSEVLRTP